MSKEIQYKPDPLRVLGIKRYSQLRREGQAITEKEARAGKPGTTQAQAQAIQRRYGL